MSRKKPPRSRPQDTPRAEPSEPESGTVVTEVSLDEPGTDVTPMSAPSESESDAAFADGVGAVAVADEAPAYDTVEADGEVPPEEHPGPARSAPRSVSEAHLRSVLESLVFASDRPLAIGELARLARADLHDVRRLLAELKGEYESRGVRLDEVAGGWLFRSAAANAPFVRELLQARPVRLTRAQIETLAILAYRQPVTRPEVDEIRGVDSGSAIKVLLERELIRVLGRKEDVGRPVLYGTTTAFLEFFGLKSLRDLPTLREFTELSPESHATLVNELGETEAPADASVSDAAISAPASDALTSTGAESAEVDNGAAPSSFQEPTE